MRYEPLLLARLLWQNGGMRREQSSAGPGEVSSPGARP
jgi:hypothetical protein